MPLNPPSSNFRCGRAAAVLPASRRARHDPERCLPVAGALAYSKYNIFVRFIMKRIARRAGAPTDASRDYEFTNWPALDRFVEGLTASRH